MILCNNNVVYVRYVYTMLYNFLIYSDIWKLGRDFKEFPAQKVVENNCLDSGPFANRVLNRSCRWSLEKLTAFVVSFFIKFNFELKIVIQYKNK